MLTTSARRLAVLANKTLRMSALLTVSLAVSRVCIEGDFRDEAAATGKQGSPCKKLGFTKGFSGIVLSETQDNSQA
ncbi:hypothetical protein [Bradyrhizobium sp. B117]|uniref:hypothetical protein n=1 Tax=Bradyrhizobium sp. B117 TaxID=3140246 RepID=UPI003182EE26